MRRLVALPLILLTLVGCGGSAADGDADPAASIPAGAIAYGELVVRPEGERKEKMAALAGRFLGTDEPGKRIVELLEKAADDRGSYEKDVEPWLGERVGFGMFDSGSEEPDVVGAAAITDAGAAREVVEREAKRDGDKNATYSDVEYWVDKAGDAVGVTDEAVLFAGDEQLMRKAIDAAEGKSLAGEDRFKNAVKPLPQDRAGTLFVDTRRLLALGGAEGEQQAQILGLVAGSVAPTAVAVLAEEDHLVFESRSRDRGGSLSWFATTKVVRELPADSLVAAGVPKLGEAARDLVARAGGALGSAVVAQQLEDEFGISLERDVYSWTGDVGIFVRGKSPEEISGGLVIEVLDEDAARKGVTRLLGALRLAAGIESRPVAIDGTDRAFELAIEGLPMRIFVALKADRAVIAVKREALLAGLERSSALGDSPRFERAREVLHGLEPSMVVDWSAALAMLSDAASELPDYEDFQPYLEAIDLIASGAEKKGDEFHSRLAIGVK